ncbi:hypothetical protein ACIBG0_40050 [Nocardia sp. NPDC050630]|uniref:hypothetical protein n=1 Tax=Nocardia sp. NPDC050630 TaxID=3364321 RepID=UPI00378E9AAC
MTKTAELTEFTTAATKPIRAGQLYEDARASNVRHLRVDYIEVSAYAIQVSCTVIRHDHGDGRVTEPYRETSMRPERLTGREFVLMHDPEVERVADILAEHIAETVTVQPLGSECAAEVVVDCLCGAEIIGDLDNEPETQIGAVQRLMAQHIAAVIAGDAK